MSADQQSRLAADELAEQTGQDRPGGEAASPTNSRAPAPAPAAVAANILSDGSIEYRTVEPDVTNDRGA